MKKPPRAQMVDEILAATAAKDRPRITLELAKLTNITARWEKARQLNDPAHEPKKRGAPRKNVGAWWLDHVSALKLADRSSSGDASDAWREGTDDRLIVETYFAQLRFEYGADKPITGQRLTAVTENGEHIVYDLRGDRPHTKFTRADIRNPDATGVIVEIRREIDSICKAISTERNRRLRAEQR